MNRVVAAILGGRGMLGADLTEACRSAGMVPKVYDLPEWNITKPEDVRRAVSDATVVVNCAAYTNVEKAESEPDPAWRINAEAVGQLGRIAREMSIPVVHISTDFVFDGRLDRPYRETDIPNPISVYGRTKYQGEQLLTASGCVHSIIRVQWTYGRAGTNFVRKIVEVARSGKPVKVVDDQIGSPTATRKVAEVIVHFLKDPSGIPQGLYHCAAAGYVSRYDMARHILSRLRMPDPQPCKTSDFVAAAQRPLNSRFHCEKIERVLPFPIDEWRGPLNQYLESL